MSDKRPEKIDLNTAFGDPDLAQAPTWEEAKARFAELPDDDAITSAELFMAVHALYRACRNRQTDEFVRQLPAALVMHGAAIFNLTHIGVYTDPSKLRCAGEVGLFAAQSTILEAAAIEAGEPDRAVQIAQEFQELIDKTKAEALAKAQAMSLMERLVNASPQTKKED